MTMIIQHKEEKLYGLTHGQYMMTQGHPWRALIQYDRKYDSFIPTGRPLSLH